MRSIQLFLGALNYLRCNYVSVTMKKPATGSRGRDQSKVHSFTTSLAHQCNFLINLQILCHLPSCNSLPGSCCQAFCLQIMKTWYWPYLQEVEVIESIQRETLQWNKYMRFSWMDWSCVFHFNPQIPDYSIGWCTYYSLLCRNHIWKRGGSPWLNSVFLSSFLSMVVWWCKENKGMHWTITYNSENLPMVSSVTRSTGCCTI